MRINFVEKGMVADICIHDKNDGNPHAHIMLTMRPFNEDKTWGNKQKKDYILDKDGSKIYDPKKRQYKCKSIPSTDWNEQTKAEEWRGAWAEAVNRYLEKSNHAERIDHRSYARQGIDIIPSIHLGVAASQMEKRGIRTERGNINREIEVTNQKLRQLNARLSKLKTWLKEEMENTEEPILADIISNILSRRSKAGKSIRYQTVNNLKAAANMMNFLTSNKIKDLAGLDEKLKSMIGKRYKIGDELKPIDRRLKVLDEHIRQAKIYREHTKINRLYQQQKSKGKQKFYDANRAELTLYESADRYLKQHLNGRDKIPFPAWKAERGKLTADKNRLNQEYATLRTETAEVEKIRRNVYDIMREETRASQRTKTQDVER